MKMSEEMAIKLHRMMWSDMQKELGDTPDSSARNKFKEKWCETHFPEEHILFNCFLCNYCGHDCWNRGCDRCPIEWPDNTCSTTFGLPPAKVDYRFAPISEILALPTRNKELTYENAAYKVGSYYEFREHLLSRASGLPASAAIGDHVKAIQEKAMQQSTFSVMYCDAKTELAKASGLPEADAVTSHISAIQEKAVDDYFAKMPLAKAITTDVDDAFKQYAKEQKAPIFKELAAASGLEELCHDVGKHISAIRKKAALDQWTTDVNVLKSITKLSYLTVEGFGSAFKAKIEDARILKDLLNKYKDRLCTASGLDYDKPIDTHLSMIRDSGFAAGKKLAKEEMLKKIEEVLKS